jgi:hypothetical protein
LLLQATQDAARFGTQYLYRASTALHGLGALANNVATYYDCNKDSTGAQLTGANGTVYTLTFPSAPPSKVFSSITMWVWRIRL